MGNKTEYTIENKKLREERDLAIAHDRQPYPTAWSYEQVCTALNAAKSENERLMEALKQIAECNFNPEHTLTCSCLNCWTWARAIKEIEDDCDYEDKTKNPD